MSINEPDDSACSVPASGEIDFSTDSARLWRLVRAIASQEGLAVDVRVNLGRSGWYRQLRAGDVVRRGDKLMIHATDLPGTTNLQS